MGSVGSIASCLILPGNDGFLIRLGGVLSLGFWLSSVDLVGPEGGIPSCLGG